MSRPTKDDKGFDVTALLTGLNILAAHKKLERVVRWSTAGLVVYSLGRGLYEKVHDYLNHKSYIELIFLADSAPADMVLTWLQSRPEVRNTDRFLVSAGPGAKRGDYPVSPDSHAPRPGESEEQFRLTPAHSLDFVWEGVEFRIEQTYDDKKEYETRVLRLHVVTKDSAVVQRWLDDVWQHHQTKLAGDNIAVYRWKGKYTGWVRVAYKRKRNTAILPGEFFHDMVADARQFLASQDFYERVGRPWIRTYLLEGLSGGGKTTSLISLASELGYDIAIANLSDCSNDDDVASMLTPPNNRTLLVLEDVDAALPVNRTTEGDIVSDNPDRLSKVTYSGILNGIDGINAAEGRILAMTTNHVEKLEGALTRPGRVDRRWTFGPATADQKRQLAVRYGMNEAEAAAWVMTPEAEALISMASVQDYLHTLFDAGKLRA